MSTPPPSREAALQALAARQSLFDAGMQPFNPFGTTAWLRHFATEVVDDVQMRADVVVAGSGDAEAVAALACDPAIPWKLTGLCNYYSSLHSPMHTRTADRGAAAASLARRLRERTPSCAVLQLAPLDDQGDLLALRAALDSDGWYTRTYFCFGNWYLPCEGVAFADYMKSRDSQVYNTWSRKAKKFRAGAEARLQIATQPDEVAAAMDAYEAVYARSWKQPEPYPHFVRGWAETCAREGWLRLGVAWVGDVPIAAQLWFTVQRRAYIFKLAYDEAYSKWSAGTVLTAHLFEQALDVDRVVEIDYLTGDDPYKKSWMSHRRERVGLLACNLRTARGLAAAAREAGAAALRRWLPKSAAPRAAESPKQP